MMNKFSSAALAPTWRLCHPVNIYVFRNGVIAEKPQLVHVPTEKKKNMSTVLEEIASRMKLPVGYPIALYTIDGCRVCKTYELEMYNYYVVVTNIEKRFKCVDYGNVKKPLIVIGSHSKHVNTLVYQNQKYDLFCRRKMRQRLHETVPRGEQNGLGPQDIPSLGKPCGVLCHHIAPPARNKPTECYSDEVMCMEGKGRPKGKEFDDAAGGACPYSAFQDQEIHELANHVRSKQKEGQCSQLMSLIKRYQHVGSDIFKMFQTRINEDLEVNRALDNKWNLPEEKVRPESVTEMKNDLEKAANATCQFAFDESGNFIGRGKDCPVNPQISIDVLDLGECPVEDQANYNCPPPGEPGPFSSKYKQVNEDQKEKNMNPNQVLDGDSMDHPGKQSLAPHNSPTAGNSPTRGMTPTGTFQNEEYIPPTPRRSLNVEQRSLSGSLNRGRSQSHTKTSPYEAQSRTTSQNGGGHTPQRQDSRMEEKELSLSPTGIQSPNTRISSQFPAPNPNEFTITTIEEEEDELLEGGGGGGLHSQNQTHPYQYYYYY